MSDLILSLLLWIGGQTHYSIPVALPNLVMTEPSNICNNYGVQDQGNCVPGKLVAFFDKDMTIYLPLGFDAQDDRDISRLLHELVHYVQWRNGESQHTCLGLMEVEAYQLQDRWLIQLGHAPASDEFRNLMLAASCEA